MTTETINIRIREDGARVVRRNIEDIGSSAEKSASGVDILKRALGALGTFLAVDQVRRYADAWASAAGMIRIATRSTEEAAAVTDRLYKSAQTTRQGFEEIVTLYSRTARAGKSLGASQEQLIKFTENVGKTLAASSTNATQAQGALMQLGQALGSGVVRAEEFNSVIEGAPAILQVVANNIKEADGDIGRLRKIMLDGKLTSKAFFDAMLAGSDQIEADFQKSSFTIAQGFTLINNALMKYIGELDASLGVSQKFGMAAKWIAENMNLVATALLAVGAAALVAFTPTAIVAFTNAVRGLWAAVAANPFLALAAAVAAAVTYIAMFKDEILIGVDATTTLGDVMRVVWADIKTGASAAYEVISTTFFGLAEIVGSIYSSITAQTAEATGDWTKQYTDFYSDVGTGFAGVVRGIARTLDAIGGLLTGLAIAAGKTIGGIPGLIDEVFNRTYNVTVGTIEALVNEVIAGVNKMRSLVGTDLLETVKFERKAVNESFFQQYGEDIASSIDEGFQQQGGFMEKWVNDVFDRAQKAGAVRAKQFGQTTVANLSDPLGKFKPPGLDEKELEKQRKELEKFKGELRSLLNTIAPVEGAKLEMAKAQETLNEAVRRGLITTKDQARYLELLNEHYKDIIDPLGKVNREFQDQARLLGMTAKARQVEAQFMEIERSLRSQGITLTREETEALRENLEAMQRLTELTAIQDQLLADSVVKRQTFITQLQAINALSADPNSGFTQGDRAQAAGGMLSSMGVDPNMLQLGLEAQTAQFETYYAQLDAMRDAQLLKEHEYAGARAQIWAKQQASQLTTAQTFFGNLSQLQASENKEMARVGKAAAIANTVINTYQSATAAYAAMAGIPYVGPALGIAAAAAAVAAGMANVAAIRSQGAGFMEGGYTGSMATNQVAGVVHGQEFVMNAEATRRIGVNNLQAMQSGQMPAGETKLDITIVNQIPNAEYEVTQMDDGRVEVIARRIVQQETDTITAGNLMNPSSRTSRALGRSTNTTRKTTS